MATKVLSKTELEALLTVPTTVEQAKQIVKRSRAALKLIRAGKEGIVRVGCPHCVAAGSTNNNYRCGQCAYREAGKGEWFACVHFAFGGHKYSHVRGWVRLQATSLEVDLDGISMKSTPVVWLKGHIEWAREVIRRAKKGARR